MNVNDSEVILSILQDAEYALTKSIENADVILAMKDGKIVEQGSHDELMLKNGFYAELWNSQYANQ